MSPYLAKPTRNGEKKTQTKKGTFHIRNFLSGYALAARCDKLVLRQLSFVVKALMPVKNVQ